MQSIYTFAKIFAARFLSGMDEEIHEPLHVVRLRMWRERSDELPPCPETEITPVVGPEGFEPSTNGL